MSKTFRPWKIDESRISGCLPPQGSVVRYGARQEHGFRDHGIRIGTNRSILLQNADTSLKGSDFVCQYFFSRTGMLLKFDHTPSVGNGVLNDEVGLGDLLDRALESSAPPSRLQPLPRRRKSLGMEPRRMESCLRCGSCEWSEA
jgi:hypothetical protein